LRLFRRPVTGFARESIGTVDDPLVPKLGPPECNPRLLTTATSTSSVLEAIWQMRSVIATALPATPNRGEGGCRRAAMANKARAPRQSEAATAASVSRSSRWLFFLLLKRRRRRPRSGRGVASRG